MIDTEEITNIKQALKRGMTREDYLCLRQTGVSHNQALQIFQYGGAARMYAQFIEDGGTYGEYEEVGREGVNMASYLLARANGASREEYKEAEALESESTHTNDRYGYGLWRACLGTHQEAMDILGTGVVLARYIDAYWSMSIKHRLTIMRALRPEIANANLKAIRETGASHDETIKVLTLGGDARLYARFVAMGGTFSELAKAGRKNVNMSSYLLARCNGATHDEVLEADADEKKFATRERRHGYGFHRANRGTHQEAMEVLENFIPLIDYVTERMEASMKPMNHPRALAEALHPDMSE